jgi:hypothetical protein
VDAAEPAHDHEGVGHDLEVHVMAEHIAGELGRADEHDESRAEREHQGELTPNA